MGRKNMNPKFRIAMAVGIDELRSSNNQARDLMAELMMEPGYIGYLDAEDPLIRIYVFNDRKSKDKMLEVAKSLGLRTAGSIIDTLYVKNEDLQRPHLKYVSRDNFYKELYK